MFDAQVFGVSAVGAIMAMLNILKEMGFPRKYVPVVSIVLGGLVGVFLIDPQNLQQGLIDGLSLGLSAVGFHSSVKNVREGVANLLNKNTSQAAQAPQQQNQQ